MQPAFFTADPDRPQVLHPTELSLSRWAADHLHGVAVSGALAVALEARVAEEGRHDLRPARYTVDLFRPAKFVPTWTEVDVVRFGPRLALLDARLIQQVDEDEIVAARASCLFLKATAGPDGLVWENPDQAAPPPADLIPVVDDPRQRWYRSGDEPWNDDIRSHDDALRKTSWQAAIPIVAGIPATPFVAAAALADATTLVTNRSDAGVQFINCDITLALARPLTSVEVGLRGLDWTGADGIAVGIASVFDRQGKVGNTMMTALANAHRTVSFDQSSGRD